LKFVSDGWRHIAELDGADNALLRSYAWGLDLSGSLDGAGGVGGLLMLNSVANGVHFYVNDGNGNASTLVKASEGTVSARYEYDPFGQTLRATGPMAAENRFQFSTKRCDKTTDFALYEYRCYHPSTGRWLSRDPIEEKGVIALYAFTDNNGINEIDPVGLVSSHVGFVYIIDGGAFLRHFGQTWSSHFGTQQSFEYGSAKSIRLTGPCCGNTGTRPCLP